MSLVQLDNSSDGTKEFLEQLSETELVQWTKLLESGHSTTAAKTQLRPSPEYFAPDEVFASVK